MELNKQVNLTNTDIEQLQETMVALSNLITDEEVKQSQQYEDLQEWINTFDEMLENDLSNANTFFSKETLEKHYRTEFTDNDVDIINREYAKIDFDDLEIEEHSLDTLDSVAWTYADINRYYSEVFNIYDSDKYGIQILLDNLNKHIIKDPNKDITPKQLILLKETDIKAFELSGGRIIHFDTSYNFEWDTRGF